MHVSARDILVIDTETTGLEPQDEIIQFSALRGDGTTILNAYFKPEKLSAWPEAEAINGISPERVAQCPPFRTAKSKIYDIFAHQHLVIGYNLPFDLNMMHNGGVKPPLGPKYLDIMAPFARLYWKANGLEEKSTWVSLSLAADFYQYQSTGSYHDSLEDCKATLHVFMCMCLNGSLPYEILKH